MVRAWELRNPQGLPTQGAGPSRPCPSGPSQNGSRPTASPGLGLVSARVAMAFSPRAAGSRRPFGPGALGGLRRVARILAHVCGLVLSLKRYIEKSRAQQWALFYLNMKNHFANELFTASSFSKYTLVIYKAGIAKKSIDVIQHLTIKLGNVSKDFEKLKRLLFIQPKQRSQENLREIRLCLKKNRSFCRLPSEIQLQLCQIVIYQEFEIESMVLRQGHVPLECYLVLDGRLKVISSNTSMRKNFDSDILNEFEEGDFIGEICLLTNANRPTSIFCETDVKLLVISKEDFNCILAQKFQEQYQETCSFLRSLLLFSSWSKEKIDFLVHCSLCRYYRPGTVIISDNLNSRFLVVIISGRCLVIAKMNYEKVTIQPLVMKAGSATAKNCHAGLPSRGTMAPTVSPKSPDYSANKTTLNTKKLQLQESSPATYFVEIRVLDKGGIFGLEETMDKSCDLHMCLISEGAECIFIPKNSFLAEASPKFRSTALGLVCPYPTEEAVWEYLVKQKAWDEFKAGLLTAHLTTGSRTRCTTHF